MSFELVCKFGAVCEGQVVVDVGADNENADGICTVRIYPVVIRNIWFHLMQVRKICSEMRNLLFLVISLTILA